jgi:ATP-dependent DNA ligase
VKSEVVIIHPACPPIRCAHSKTKAALVESMDCLAVSKLPEGSLWLWEIKLDGYRALAVKSGNDVFLTPTRVAE